MPRSGYIYREGVTTNTRLLSTQKVKVYSFDSELVGFNQIGVVQTWNPTQTRAVEPHRGIGFGDQIAELAVGVTDLQASCSVMMMYLRDIMQVFGYKAGTSGLIRSLKHHRWPFDVKEEIVLPEFLVGEAQKTQGSGVVLTWYEGCWMTDYSKSFNMGDTATTQDTTMQITDVYADPGEAVNTFADTSNNRKSKLYAANK